MLVFPARTLLQKEITATVEDEDVDRAMAQIRGVDLMARSLTDALSISSTTSKISPCIPAPLLPRRARRDKIGQRDPLLEAEFLGARRSSTPRCCVSAPVGDAIGQILAQLLAPLRKALLHEP
jgi:hypothetical protein